MKNILSNYGGKNAGVTSDLHDKMNSQYRRKYCFTQRIPGIDPLCRVSGVFPRSGLSSDPSRPTSKSGSTRLRWCVLPPLERFILCHLCDCMHQPSQSAFSVIGTRKDKKKSCFTSATASVVLSFEVCTVCSESSITRACLCMLMSSFPSQLGQMGGQSILDHQNPSIIYSCLSTWWDISGVTPDRCLGSPCQQWWIFPFWLPSPLSIQSDLSPDHQRHHARATSARYETVCAYGCMIQPVHPLISSTVCPLDSCAGKRCKAGVTCGKALLRLSICMVQVPLLQLHWSALLCTAACCCVVRCMSYSHHGLRSIT